MKTFSSFSVLFLLAGMSLSLMFFVTRAHAQSVPQQTTFYGTLQNSSGDALSGTFDMVFRFYDAPTGGTLLDTSTHTASNGNPVTVSNGEFAVQLGSGTGNALDGINFNTSTIYVGLSIAGEAESTPRTRFSAAPYAFNSDMLDGYHATYFLRGNATGTIATSSTDTILTITQNGTGNILDLYDGSTNVLTVTGIGNLGLGTTTPTRTLTVDGDLQLTGLMANASNTVGNSGDLLISRGTGIGWNATTSFSGGSGSSLFTDAGTFTYLTATTSFLALGTTTAPQLLTLADGNLNITGNGGLLLGGRRMLYGSSTGVFGMGWNAGGQLDQGLHNLSFGFLSGSGITGTSSNYNLFMGTVAGTFARDTSYSVVMGRQAGQFMSGDHNFYIGYGTGNSAAGNYNFGYGQGAMGSIQGSSNIGIGHQAAANIIGDANVAVGPFAGGSGYGNFSSIFLGDNAGGIVSGSSHVIASGYNSAAELSGNHVITIGSEAGALSGRNGLGDGNIYFGNFAFGRTSDGQYNVGIGLSVGQELISSSSVIIGSNSYTNTSLTFPDADHIVSIGYQNYPNYQDGTHQNIFIGSSLNNAVNTIRRSIFIGDTIQAWTSTSSLMSVGNVLFGTNIFATGTTLSSGNVGIGTNAPTARLHVAGTLRFSSFGAGTLQTDASGNVSVSSDERLKDIASTYLEGIDALMGIEPITYRWNDVSGFETDTEYIGFSAQNVQANIPGAVGEDPNGFLTLSDRGILATVVNAVKEVWQSTEAIATSTEAIVAATEELTVDVNVDMTRLEEIDTRLQRLEGEREQDPVEHSAASTTSEVTEESLHGEGEAVSDVSIDTP